jgi:hypothetical protein
MDWFWNRLKSNQMTELNQSSWPHRGLETSESRLELSYSEPTFFKGRSGSSLPDEGHDRPVVCVLNCPGGGSGEGGTGCKPTARTLSRFVLSRLGVGDDTSGEDTDVLLFEVSEYLIIAEKTPDVVVVPDGHKFTSIARTAIACVRFVEDHQFLDQGATGGHNGYGDRFEFIESSDGRRAVDLLPVLRQDRCEVDGGVRGHPADGVQLIFTRGKTRGVAEPPGYEREATRVTPVSDTLSSLTALRPVASSAALMKPLRWRSRCRLGSWGKTTTMSASSEKRRIKR